jgi:hypothetical protein
MTYSTYCSKSWTDINLDFETRTLRHCCKAEGHEFPETLTEQFISIDSIIQERRQQSLDKVAHSDCNSCWKDYAKGNSAYRDWANRWTEDFINNHKTVLGDDSFVHYIEVKPDSTCDLACIYCSYTSSSKIAQEEGVKVEVKTKEEDYVVFKSWIKNHIQREDLHFGQLLFVFLGGEPTASERFYELVDFIEAAAETTNKSIRLEICTNANSKKFLMDKIIAKMDTSKLSWGIGISNESYGETAELIRHGLDWQRYTENFKRYITHPKTELIVLSPTVNIFNLKSFPEYIIWVYDQFRTYAPYKQFTWYGNYISWPDELDISHLPKEYIKYVEQAEQAIADCSGGTNNVYKENFIKFIDTMKQRIGAAYNPDYKQVAQEFLERKQLVKKTDKLIKLMENLDL